MPTLLRIARVLALAAACLSVVPGAAPAAPPADPAPNPAAVGWLGYGAAPKPGAAGCSGVLVAPDLVVTAAHCLVDARSGQPRDAGRLTFAAGWRDGQAAGSAKGAEIILPAARRLLDGALPYDLALLRLAHPLEAVTPLPLAPDAAPADASLTTLGYPQAAPDRARRQDDCQVRLAAPPVIGLSCHAVGGFSGGAVLRQVGNGWLLQGVMVAEATRNPAFGALALSLPDDLAARIDRR